MPDEYRYCPRCAQPLSDREQGGFVRRACAACEFVHWNNPVPVVAAIVEHEGAIVLARNALWPPEMYALIAGFLEKEDASPSEGVLREVHEELGLTGEVVSFVGHYPFRRMNQLILAYHVRASGRIQLDAELVDYRHYRFDELHPWPGATGTALRDWMIASGLKPLPYESPPLRAIRDFHAVDRQLLTGGQPQLLQFKALRFADVQTVINLAPPGAAGAPADERAEVEALGMRYHAVPVVWQAPTDADFERFCSIMDAETGRKLFVHCVANKRVSAFVFLYRVLRLGVAAPSACEALDAVWQPDAVWSAFIDRQLAGCGEGLDSAPSA